MFGRGLEEIGGWAHDGSCKFAVERDLGTADGVDHHACRVGAVPYFEFEFQVERHVAEGGAFHADVAPLAVGQPGDMVARPNVDVVLADVVGDHAGDRVGLGNLLAFEAFAFKHVEEVCIAAEVELIGAVDFYAAIHEQAGEDTMNDRCADLAFDVIAENGQTRICKAFAPIFRGCDENGNGIDQGAARFDDLFHVPFGCHL